MAENLFSEWHTFSNVELSVYRELKTENERTVVTEDLESKVSGFGESFKGALESVGERFAGGANSIGASVTSWTAAGASAFNAVTQAGSNFIGGSVPGIAPPASLATGDGPPDGSGNISAADSDKVLSLD